MKKIIKSVINGLGYEVFRKDNRRINTAYPNDFEQTNTQIINLVRDKTMTSPERIHSLLEAVRYITLNSIEGAVVECGVWRGGSMMAAAYMLKQLHDTQRELYLFDTFSGMTPPTSRDVTHFNVDAQSLLKGNERDAYQCYAQLDEVKKNLQSTSYPFDKIHFVEGKVEDSIPGSISKKIALLRLDTDWYESTRHELEHLFPLLTPGGVIIIDDYGYWKGCRQATDEYIKDNKIPLLLNRIDSTGRIGIKLS